jgi:mono/diheme cytochrome c family protein
MAATDQTYRPQRTLDVVFGVSCLLMLVSIVWMFWDDYNRPFKQEIRHFRDVEEAVAERKALTEVPAADKIKQAEEDVRGAKEELAAKQSSLDDAKSRLNAELPIRVKAEADYQSVKADYDSAVSKYHIAVEEQGVNSSEANRMDKEVKRLKEKLDQRLAAYEVSKAREDKARKDQTELEKPLTEALDRLKKLNSDFDRFAKNAALKRWKTGDWVRALPVLDAFASPERIEQYTLNELPIDYSFKYVTRFDRCTTCHQGIARASYDKQTLRDLAQAPADLDTKLKDAMALIQQRKQLLEGTDEKLDYDPSELRTTKVNLSERQVSEYCAHPRLDLFVEANSPHPAEKFGCTICHGGQGSGTEFNLASHTPNNAQQKEDWTKKEGWESNHFWDYPMLPKRFVESSCLKCHHMVTDLLPNGNLTEKREDKFVDSPGAKVLRGYNLIREFGCFGCHEIAGNKGGREVGPDLRLEPSPPLEVMTASERLKMMADPANPPGTMRKVGPSLRRIVEKTNPEWTRKWLHGPRDFRPDTRMPHFYGLANNTPDVLPDAQKKFPDAEMHAIVHYLFQESNAYLQGKDLFYQTALARKAELEDKKKSNLISEVESKELEEVIRRLELAKRPTPIKSVLTAGDGKIVSLPPAPKDDKDRQKQIKEGRQLFTEKGCLACHSHQGTMKEFEDLPAVDTKADFGPNLSRLAAKIVPAAEKGDEDAKRRWLVQWIINPNIHFPRTRMPITHLNAEEAAAIAAWLLSQDAGWDAPDVSAPDTATLESMARTYLAKILPGHELDRRLQARGYSAEEIKDLAPDADERHLAQERGDESWDDKLKWYVGKKAIGQLGCFGCHDIPGFELAKPIGTPLNDWGKKDPERLAFEDIVAYVQKHHYKVDAPDDKGQPEADKTPYETFFWDALEHHTRDGFLNQKLREPRSYDYARLRAWDERLRMPQFKFARHNAPPEGESKEESDRQQMWQEADAREAVMTFVLGLLAEPIPLKYVYDPQGDRLAVAKGRKVLDKFNCAGCHQLHAGEYEFNPTMPTKDPDGNDTSVLQELESQYKRIIESDGYKGDDFKLDDPEFAHHNAWVGLGQARPDVLKVHGLFNQVKDTDIQLRLTEALRFNDSNKRALDIPAAETLSLPQMALVGRRDVEGGVLTNALVPYLVARKAKDLDTPGNARSGLPPPLLREGERAQPGWLFQFLRNPFKIRPPTILRMPRFNMSDDEAMALVNYFAATDRLSNPAAGLQYPYLTVPERDDGYLTVRNQEYVARLGKDKLAERTKELLPVWERLLKDRIDDLEEQLKVADKAVAAAKDADKAEATKRRDALKAELTQRQDEAKAKDKEGPFIKKLREQWQDKEVYSTDAYRLLANYSLCLNCHQVGSLDPKLPIGPALTLAQDRLRPEFTRLWIASPQRLLIYADANHPMPQPFERGVIKYPEFTGTALEKATALRDILMNYPGVAAEPANRAYRPSAEGVK